MTVSGELPIRAEVVVVGGGLAGLVCARRLASAGRDVVVIERDSHWGGRVFTEVEQGFRWDLGFQVLLTGYPAARRWLDFDRLDLRTFPAGAMIHDGRQWCPLGDPLRDPARLISTLTCPVGSPADKVKIALLRLALALKLPIDKSGTTSALLERWGFSTDFRQRFFEPFFGGVFLESELATSASKFCRLFHLFSTSRAAVPSQGMHQIPLQLVAPLVGRAFLDTPALEWSDSLVRTPRGDLQASRVVLAGVDPYQRQCGVHVPFDSTRTHYFAARGWQRGDWLHLGPPGCSFAVVAPLPAYSSAGKTLLAVSVVQGRAEADLVGRQVQTLFPEVELQWLRTHDIDCALPREVSSLERSPRISERLFACGDHLQTGSIEGAMESGEKAARAVLDSF